METELSITEANSALENNTPGRQWPQDILQALAENKIYHVRFDILKYFIYSFQKFIPLFWNLTIIIIITIISLKHLKHFTKSGVNRNLIRVRDR